jgi:hypothetical protein
MGRDTLMDTQHIAAVAIAIVLIVYAIGQVRLALR